MQVARFQAWRFAQQASQALHRHPWLAAAVVNARPVANAAQAKSAAAPIAIAKSVIANPQ